MKVLLWRGWWRVRGIGISVILGDLLVLFSRLLSVASWEERKPQEDKRHCK
jgi:hypothetical protein